MSSTTLIVGAGQAGGQLAASLRTAKPDERIILVGAERHQPYQRPPLSKEVLAGRAEAATTALRSPQFYADQRIEVLTGVGVIELGLAPHSRGSGVAGTSDGREIPFNRLALTVGSRPRRLDLPGADLAGVCYLRDLDDSLALRDRLPEAGAVVIIGGGFIGLEVAAVARAAGKRVTVVESAARLMARAVDPIVSEFYRLVHMRRGTDVRLGSQVVEITGTDGRVRSVLLSDGTRLSADVVLIGVGVTPRTELAEQIGVICVPAIVVDEQARASRPGVVAAGDCTVQPNPITGAGLVCLESLPNAISQARVAAASLVGAPQPRIEAPWFWSDQFDVKLQTAGVSEGADDVILRGDPATESFSLLYFRAGRLIAVNAINRPADYLTVRRALSSGVTVEAGAAKDETVPLKQLIVRAPYAS